MSWILQKLKTLFSCVFGIFHPGPRQKKQTEITAHRKADEVVALLEAEDWANLRQHFWAPLRWLLPPTLLKKGFDGVRLTTGSLEHAGSPVVSSGWLTSVKVPMRFKRAKLAMSLTMTPHGSLVGLNFLPQQLAGFGNAWQPPPYAHFAEFDQVELELGNSRSKVKGTLMLPRGDERYPCLVMLAGSGPTDRDSSVEACKPFKDLALGLVGQGVATLRFDKVTFTHGSRLRNSKNFTLTDEYTEHALDAVRQCLAHDKVRADAVFFLGHSLGGYVVPKLASLEPRIAGCILMAAPTVPMYRSALRQLRHFATMEAVPDRSRHQQIEELEQECDLADSPDLNMSTPRSKLPLGIGPAYWLDCRSFAPVETASALKKPVLVMQGGRDYQVTVEDDYARWQAALEAKPGFTFRLYDSLNHLFIAGEGPSTPLDYDTPGNVHEQVIGDLSRWVLETISRKPRVIDGRPTTAD